MVAGLCWVGYVSAAPAPAGPVTLEVLNPIATFEVARVALPPSLADLNNKTIGLFANYKIHADVAVKQVGKLLQERFTGVKLVFFHSLSGNKPLSAEDLKFFTKPTKVDAIVGSTAD